MEVISFIPLYLNGLFMLTTSVYLVSVIRVVRDDTRLSVYRLGRHIGDKGPGLVVVIPFIDRAVLKQLDALEKIPSRRFVGDVGETRTTVHTDGIVFMAGEDWDL